MTIGNGILSVWNEYGFTSFTSLDQAHTRIMMVDIFCFQSLWGSRIGLLLILLPELSATVADLHTKVSGAQADPIMSFLQTFLEKSTCVVGWCPPPTNDGSRPPKGNPGSAPVIITIQPHPVYYTCFCHKHHKTLGFYCQPTNHFTVANVFPEGVCI